MSRMLQALKNLEAREANAPPAVPAAPPAEVQGHESLISKLAFADNALAWLAADTGGSVAFPAKPSEPAAALPTTSYELLEPTARSAAPVYGEPPLTTFPVISVASTPAMEQESAYHSALDVTRDEAAAKAPAPIFSTLERLVRKQLYEPEVLPLFQQMVARLGQDVAVKAGRAILLTACEGTHCGDLLMHLAMLWADEGEKVLVVDGNVAAHRLTRELLSQQEGRLETALRRQVRPTGLVPRVLPLATTGVSLLALHGVDLSSQEPASLQREWESLKKRYTTILIDGGSSQVTALKMLGQLSDATYMVIHLGVTESQAAKQHVSYLQSIGANVQGCLATID